MPQVLAALDDLLWVRGELDLRDVGRAAVTGLLGRIGAKPWIDWRVEGGSNIDQMTMSLWRRCREQAYYLQALPEAQAWRQGLVEVRTSTVPSDALDRFAQAREVGYAVIEFRLDPAQRRYSKWCGEHALPLVIVSLSDQFWPPADPNVGGDVAWVSGSLVDCKRGLARADQALLEATCRVCVPAGQATVGGFVQHDSVHATVPRGLAVPLAARVRDILGWHSAG